MTETENLGQSGRARSSTACFPCAAFLGQVKPQRRIPHRHAGRRIWPTPAIKIIPADPLAENAAYALAKGRQGLSHPHLLRILGDRPLQTRGVTHFCS